MKKSILTLTSFIFFSILISCSSDNKLSDAFGNFEAIEITVSSEVQGKILSLNIEEGTNLDSGIKVGFIDTVNLWLKLKQVESQKSAVQAKVSNVISQINVQNQQKTNFNSEKKRIEKLLKDKAVPEKQLDDINNAISLIDKQIELIKTQNQSVFSELDGMDYQIKQVKDQIKKSYIINPIKGTVLEKYMEQSEMVVPGKAIYKIANLDEIILRAYISEKQLANVKVNQKATVLFDDGKGGLKEVSGNVFWISSQSEFTPKIIQTRYERQSLVYAIKIKVKNNGTIKIGMPGELQLRN
ncbi:MAG: HlyD family secretion protein [Bacteroidetes bacterium CG23_combo_of_CG06-09_8_20_14_all_32_9]|nr:MAG: HlyD family secretion protein [Bacteroidetes bacterium CG23_combo_of_CG06-09_8_20_14_all_32_9]